jgi:hypothetical protein
MSLIIVLQLSPFSLIFFPPTSVTVLALASDNSPMLSLLFETSFGLKESSKALFALAWCLSQWPVWPTLALVGVFLQRQDRPTLCLALWLGIQCLRLAVALPQLHQRVQGRWCPWPGEVQCPRPPMLLPQFPQLSSSKPTRWDLVARRSEAASLPCAMLCTGDRGRR